MPDVRIPTPDERIPMPHERIPLPDERIPNPETRIPSSESRIPNPESRASLAFRGERPITETGELHLAFHRILAVDRPGVRGVQRLPLHIDRELERDILALHRAGQFGFAQLTAVVACE